MGQPAARYSRRVTPVRRHVLVRGRVQNVWFRQSCVEEARRRDIAGWVRNLADGRVEAVFEGEDALIDEMVSWCWRGSPLAVVANVEVSTESPAGESGFVAR